MQSHRLTVQLLNYDILCLVSDDGSKQSFIAVYVCVPILVAAVFVSVLIVFYYKR